MRRSDHANFWASFVGPVKAAYNVCDGGRVMGNRVFFFSSVLLTVLVLSTSVVFAADVFAGVWKMNIVDPSLVAASNVTQIESLDNGIRLVGDSVDLEGIRNHLEFTAQFDGKDYPFRQMVNEGIITNENDKVSVKRIDDYAVQVTRKRNGNVLAVVTMVASKDGKKMTSTAVVVGAGSTVTTFERQ
jgi:hypothetical protein